MGQVYEAIDARLREFILAQPVFFVGTAPSDVEVSRVSDSCGFAVPAMTYESDRDLLPQYWARRSPEETVDYRERKNATSIDGLPALPLDRLVG